MDAKTVSDYSQKNDNTQEPDLASRFYVISYDYLLRHEEGSSNPHIGKNLETHYHWNWDEEVALMTSGFHGAGGSISALAKLIEGFGMQASMPYPKTIEILTALCRFAFRGVHDSCLVLNQPNRHPRQLVEFCRSQVIYGYDFFKAMSTALDYIIEKQVTSLTPDSACQIIRIEGNILLNTLIQENGGARELLSSKRGEFPDMHPGELPTLIMNDWKFNMFKKLIMSTQMQLRVSSVVNMSTELKNMYQNANKIGEASQSPLLLYFADFILRNKLVEYLVGIASHPEIIVESDAVLGFLIVTKTYKSSQVNSIWQIVTTSQDPRVVEAILKMLKKCLNLHTYAELMFLCRKVKSLPIEAFTMVMRDFCQELCRYLVDKARHEGVQRIDSPPYDMCVRLVRESSVITPESPAGHPEIQTFATIQLRDLLPYGPSDHSRQEIYLECILDVSARAPTSPGSICVINALLRSNHFADLSTMTTEHGLTGLVIQELESTIAEDQHYSNPSIRLSPASLAHRELLLAIIVQEPDTISPELGTKLWNLLVGNASKNVIDRDMWWQMLNNALTKSASDNSFIAACFNDYFPTLSPACFTTGALEFARKAITSWLKDAAQTVGETLVFESPALEQLWRMILKAPPNTIDEAAILSLVGVYVDSALILSLPRAKARIIHSALVDRCLQQLATAARNLKSYDQDATTHNVDEAMVLVPSEAEFQEQELVFARSLAVLREFLRLYHLKPQFATPKSISPLTSSTIGMEGELLTVKYQCFDGDKHTEIESLTLGKLNPAASLFTGIQKATGFKKFKLFCGGKGLDPDDVEVCRSLEDLNLNGLVLVQRRDGDDGPAPSSVMKTSLEGEITKHFDDLWGYLGMHEKVAQEVWSDPQNL
jgi:ubiquitin carboxyl-terminal hydrolase 34